MLLFAVALSPGIFLSAYSFCNPLSALGGNFFHRRKLPNNLDEIFWGRISCDLNNPSNMVLYGSCFSSITPFPPKDPYVKNLSLEMISCESYQSSGEPWIINWMTWKGIVGYYTPLTLFHLSSCTTLSRVQTNKSSKFWTVYYFLFFVFPLLFYLGFFTILPIASLGLIMQSRVTLNSLRANCLYMSRAGVTELATMPSMLFVSFWYVPVANFIMENCLVLH